jgi:GAF domain-containing protein
MTNKFERYHDAQSWFAKNTEFYKTSRSEAFKAISQKIAEVMGVGRVGIWFLSLDKQSIKEELTYVGESSFMSGTTIYQKDAPSYFQGLNSDRVLIFQNTKDERFSQSLRDYLKKFQIKTMLDAPVFSDGEVIGVLIWNFFK